MDEHSKWILSLWYGLAFLIVASKPMYRLVNALTSKASILLLNKNNCPNYIGLILHALVFVLVARLLMALHLPGEHYMPMNQKGKKELEVARKENYKMCKPEKAKECQQTIDVYYGMMSDYCKDEHGKPDSNCIEKLSMDLGEELYNNCLIDSKYSGGVENPNCTA